MQIFLHVKSNLEGVFATKPDKMKNFHCRHLWFILMIRFQYTQLNKLPFFLWVIVILSRPSINRLPCEFNMNDTVKNLQLTMKVLSSIWENKKKAMFQLCFSTFEGHYLFSSCSKMIEKMKFTKIYRKLSEILFSWS